jgi:hypothetical protein
MNSYKKAGILINLCLKEIYEIVLHNSVKVIKDIL